MAVNVTVVPDQRGIEHAARVFVRKVKTSGTMRDIQRQSFYIKPSAVRRIKAAKARRRTLKYATRQGETFWRLEAEERRYGGR